MSPDTAAQRLRGDTARPLLAGDDAITRWNQLYQERRGIYEQLASLRIRVDELSVPQIVDMIQKYLSEV